MVTSFVILVLLNVHFTYMLFEISTSIFKQIFELDCKKEKAKYFYFSYLERKILNSVSKRVVATFYFK